MLCQSYGYLAVQASAIDDIGATLTDLAEAAALSFPTGSRLREPSLYSFQWAEESGQVTSTHDKGRLSKHFAKVCGRVPCSGSAGPRPIKRQSPSRLAKDAAQCADRHVSMGQLMFPSGPLVIRFLAVNGGSAPCARKCAHPQPVQKEQQAGSSAPWASTPVMMSNRRSEALLVQSGLGSRRQHSRRCLRLQ